jgi:hypothetical protein
MCAAEAAAMPLVFGDLRALVFLLLGVIITVRSPSLEEPDPVARGTVACHLGVFLKSASLGGAGAAPVAREPLTSLQVQYEA